MLVMPKRIQVSADPVIVVAVFPETSRPTVRCLSSSHERATAVDIDAAVMVADELFQGVITLHDPYAHDSYRSGVLAPCRSLTVDDWMSDGTNAGQLLVGQDLRALGYGGLQLGLAKAVAAAPDRADDVRRAIVMTLSGVEYPLPHPGGELRMQLIGEDGASAAELTVQPYEPDGVMFVESTLMCVMTDTHGQDGAAAADLVAKFLWCIGETVPQLSDLRRAILRGLPLGSTILTGEAGGAGEIKAKA